MSSSAQWAADARAKSNRISAEQLARQTYEQSIADAQSTFQNTLTTANQTRSQTQTAAHHTLLTTASTATLTKATAQAAANQAAAENGASDEKPPEHSIIILETSQDTLDFLFAEEVNKYYQMIIACKTPDQWQTSVEAIIAELQSSGMSCSDEQLAHMRQYVAEEAGRAAFTNEMRRQLDMILAQGAPGDIGTQEPPEPRQSGEGAHWFNNDWTDWINPVAYVCSYGYPLGERIGDGYATVFVKDDV